LPPTTVQPMRMWIIRFVGLALIALLLVLLSHYAPLQPLSYAVWGGIVLMLAGLVTLVKPVRLLGIGSRARALVVLLVGLACVVAALSWPAATIHALGPRQRLDDFMPAFEFYERHETLVRAAPNQVREAARSVSASDMPAAVFLMRVRAAAAGRFDRPNRRQPPILGTFEQRGSGFLPLDLTRPNELVYGMVGRPWAGGPRPPVSSPEQFLAFREPGNIKVAFNMRWDDAGQGKTRISTETRCTSTDAAAGRIFARYWRVIYPGSAIIRRVWLDTIAERAERPPDTH